MNDCYGENVEIMGNNVSSFQKSVTYRATLGRGVVDPAVIGAVVADWGVRGRAMPRGDVFGADGDVARHVAGRRAPGWRGCVCVFVAPGRVLLRRLQETIQSPVLGRPPFELISSELCINLIIGNLVGEWNYDVLTMT